MIENKDDYQKRYEENEEWKRRVVFVKDGLLLTLFAGTFLLFGIFGLFLAAIYPEFRKHIPAYLFLIFLGSPAFYGIKLMLNKKRNDGGLFPPIFLFICGVFFMFMSCALYLDKGNSELFTLIFGFLFGAKCIHLAYKRWHSA